MSEKIHDIVHNLLDGIHGIAKSETIVGAPQQAGDAMVIPVHRLKVAFGVGSAKGGARGESAGGESGGMAAGGAIELDPVAAIAVGKDGVPRILTVDGHAEGTWAALLQEVPDLAVKVIHALGDRVNTEVKTRLAEHPTERAEKVLEQPKELPACASSWGWSATSRPTSSSASRASRCAVASAAPTPTAGGSRCTRARRRACSWSRPPPRSRRSRGS